MNKRTRRRLTSFALAVVMALVSTMPIMARTATFNDVPTTHFAFDAINWVSDPANGSLMVAEPGNNFHPNRHVNKFDAARIYAMAAGFRHMTHTLPQAEQEAITRSFDTWRPLLDTMAGQFSRWQRTADREIAFLLYRGILTPDDVETFVTLTGTQETIAMLTRQEAVAWMVRLIGRGAQAQAIPLPHPNPFRDDALIDPALRRYIYYAREAGIIQGGADGYMNPTNHFTRAEMAVVFFNALANNQPAPPPTQPGGTTVTITGSIASMFLDTHISIMSAAGTETFTIAPQAVIMVDNQQRTPAFLQAGMSVTALVNPQRQVISIVARSADAGAPTVPGQALNTDEGFVTAVVPTAPQSITIRTQRVRIDGQIINEERTFSIAPNASITRGGTAIYLSAVQQGDIAFFGFTGNVIHELNLMERERTLQGTLLEMRPAADALGMPIMRLEMPDGPTYELRVTSTTAFSRGHVQNLNWNDLRIGDTITADVEFDRLVRVHGVGTRTNAEGRLTEIRITERNSQITIALGDGEGTRTFYVMPGMFDVYTLRIGMQLRIMLDSREVVDIEVRSGTQAQGAAILGVIQSIRADGTITVLEGQGTAARTHTIVVNSGTTITRGGTTLNFDGLRVNMNVHIALTAPQSNVAGSITVLP